MLFVSPKEDQQDPRDRIIELSYCQKNKWEDDWEQYLGEGGISEIQVSGLFKCSSRYFSLAPSYLIRSLVPESRDEILLRGEGCNTLVLLSANHELRFAN